MYTCPARNGSERPFLATMKMKYAWQYLHDSVKNLQENVLIVEESLVRMPSDVISVALVYLVYSYYPIRIIIKSQYLLLSLNISLLSGISNAEARQPGKAPNFSVNWTVGDTCLEVINATTGKDEMGRASRLCKHALYSRWMRIHAKVHILKCKIFHF